MNSDFFGGTIIGLLIAGFLTLIFFFGGQNAMLPYNVEIAKCQQHLQKDEKCHMIAVPEQVTLWTVKKMMDILSKGE